MSNSPTPAVLHEPENRRFIIQMERVAAVLEYHLNGPRMTITHTFVPDTLRGKGLAGYLAKAAFDFARTNDLRVVPQCSYIATYAQRHPDVQPLLY